MDWEYIDWGAVLTIGSAILIIGLLVAVIMIDEAVVESDCRELCSTNGETYYKSSSGYRSNDVCLCKTKEGKIEDYVIG